MKIWFPWLGHVTPTTFRADILAALTGASLAIPQGVAFATIAGLPPEYGFYCALVAPVIAIVLGSSWHMVCGPTTAISALLFSALQSDFAVGSAEFIQAAITLTFIAGLVQVALGIARLGSVTHFVSHAVMAGFITGAAILIILSQVKYALAIDLPRPEQFIDYLQLLPTQLMHTDYYALAVSGVTMISAIIIKKIHAALPHYLIALVLGSLIGAYFQSQGADLVTVGRLPGVIPPFSAPNLSVPLIQQIAPGAVAIAFVGLLEAASIAKAISLKTEQKLDANREFIGQGLSNVVGSFFSSYMSSGSFTRSGVNVESGAKTPLAVIFMSLFLFVILQTIAPLFAHLPLSAMASIIILVGWRLIAFEEIRFYLRRSKTETAIAATTLFGTLLVSLEFGLYAGIGLSLALFLKQSIKPTVRILAPMKTEQGTYFHNTKRFNLTTCPQIHFISLDGPVFFGAVDYLEKRFEHIQQHDDKPHWIVLGIGISDIDMHGSHMLTEVVHSKQRSNGNAHFVVRSFWKRQRLETFGFIHQVGENNVYPAKGIAIEEVVPQLDQSICQHCDKKIFAECPGK
ncbi:SulP family inorganic anion transporter [Vibrio olivae]|uniref:SulP family inorganic anion transporter n=1 Tax=Vibrio olivae TaxID=1243002 RepID=A0ABV5HS39_9VIBR